jgi:DNA-binding NtrC family response regulator
MAVNCGAISDQLAESELFGHESGSFTGAVGRREGWFEAAHGGTLFLDEVGDLPIAMQVKLLRVLQEREVVRIGSRKSIAVDVRLVAATSVDLDHAVTTGRFRRDLFYRLNTAQARLPALRERPADVLPLAEHFLKVHCKRMNRPTTRLSMTAMSMLLAHSWPGNIRELENVIHFALLMSNSLEIQPEHLKVREWTLADAPAAATVQPSADPLEVMAAQLRRAFLNPGDTLFDDLERLIVTETYQHCGNNQVQSAALLGISRNVLRTLLKRHGLLSDSTFTEQRVLPGRWSLQAPGL